jgi:hypothetical protein
MIFVTVMILSFSVLIFPIMMILNYGDALIKPENTKKIINPNMTGINQSSSDLEYFE